MRTMSYPGRVDPPIGTPMGPTYEGEWLYVHGVDHLTAGTTRPITYATRVFLDVTIPAGLTPQDLADLYDQNRA